MTTRIALDGTQVDFSVLGIPYFLFKEIGEKLGKGPSRKLSLDLTWYEVIGLDKEKTGCEGAIGYKGEEDGSRAQLTLWRHNPTKHGDYVEEVLVVNSGPRDAGRWARGAGTLTRDSCWLDLRGGPLQATHPQYQLVVHIFIAAGQLARDPACYQRTYWDNFSANAPP